LALFVAFTDTYDIRILQVWYLSIDIQFIVIHVEFEDVLSVWVWRERATCYQNWELRDLKFLKRHTFLKAACPLLFHTLKLLWICHTAACQRVFYWEGVFKRLKSRSWFQVDFIDRTRLMLSYMLDLPLND
jgi:hypothetical protein